MENYITTIRLENVILYQKLAMLLPKLAMQIAQSFFSKIKEFVAIVLAW